MKSSSDPTDLAGCLRPTPAHARVLDLGPRGRAHAPAADDLQRMGSTLPETRLIPDWCGCSIEYLPVLTGDGWWHLVPIWEPEQTANPLRRWQPAIPYWTR